MKKLSALLLILCLCFTAALAELEPSAATLSINGVRAAFFAEDGTYLPLLEADSVVYAPAEQLGSYLGLAVTADAATAVVRVSGIPTAFFGEDGAYLSPVTRDGIVYVPLKAFAESASVPLTVRDGAYAINTGTAAPTEQPTPQPTATPTAVPTAMPEERQVWVELTQELFNKHFTVTGWRSWVSGGTWSSSYETLDSVSITLNSGSVRNVKLSIEGHEETLTRSLTSDFRFSYTNRITRKSSSATDEMVYKTQVTLAESGLGRISVSVKVISGEIRVPYSEVESIFAAKYA